MFLCEIPTSLAFVTLVVGDCNLVESDYVNNNNNNNDTDCISTPAKLRCLHQSPDTQNVSCDNKTMSCDSQTMSCDNQAMSCDCPTKSRDHISPAINHNNGISSLDVSEATNSSEGISSQQNVTPLRVPIYTGASHSGKMIGKHPGTRSVKGVSHTSTHTKHVKTSQNGCPKSAIKVTVTQNVTSSVSTSVASSVTPSVTPSFSHTTSVTQNVTRNVTLTPRRPLSHPYNYQSAAFDSCGALDLSVRKTTLKSTTRQVSHDLKKTRHKHLPVYSPINQDTPLDLSLR